MNKLIIFYLLIFFSACSILIKENNEQKNIIIKGSNTLHPLLKVTSMFFSKENSPNTKFSISSGGSNTGLVALRENTTDIAVSSRQMRWEEKAYFADHGIEIKEEIIAYDALGIIVHPSNSITNLSFLQVQMIFSGLITNWKELGGIDHEILLIRRDSKMSGTDDFFNELLLHGKEPVGKIKSQILNKDIVDDVINNPHAIAYMGYGSIDSSVKTIAISSDGVNFFYPEKKSIQSLHYPIIRPLYAYYRKERMKKVYDFINFLNSKTGQQLVESANYIPRKIIEGIHLHILPI